ncbi:hypothetical protein COHA_002197 [Chlorella ohadii]|uniref:Uncharacterized protein n=1 Tax=Chlorella ohadii TaxID=2649997 RepID=A0AAD5H7M5_9CHLO|nr:hypothetical protein COHA_002197 [Chlorella ohadii]
MARQLRQAQAVARAASNWVRHDLREILFPSSIPTPPGIEEEHEQRPRRNWPKLFVRVCRRYVETWDSAKMRAERAARDEAAGVAAEQRREEEGPTLGEEFALAAKGGTQALKPFLANLYQSRARSYRDAVQQFVQGYKQVGGPGGWWW